MADDQMAEIVARVLARESPWDIDAVTLARYVQRMVGWETVSLEDEVAQRDATIARLREAIEAAIAGIELELRYPSALHAEHLRDDVRGLRAALRVAAYPDRPGPDGRPDWTMDAAGRSNASPVYRELVAEVERLIRGDAATILSGRSDITARLIVSQLAHVHGLAPTGGGS